MVYMGSKSKYAKYIVPILQKTIDALEKYIKMQIPKNNDECNAEEECP